jgi:hypothetical protein
MDTNSKISQNPDTEDNHPILLDKKARNQFRFRDFFLYILKNYSVVRISLAVSLLKLQKAVSAILFPWYPIKD